MVPDRGHVPTRLSTKLVLRSACRTSVGTGGIGHCSEGQVTLFTSAHLCVLLWCCRCSTAGGGTLKVRVEID